MLDRSSSYEKFFQLIYHADPQMPIFRYNRAREHALTTTKHSMAIWAWAVGALSRPEGLRDKSANFLKSMLDQIVAWSIESRSVDSGPPGFNNIGYFKNNSYNIPISENGRIWLQWVDDFAEDKEVVAFRTFWQTVQTKSWIESDLPTRPTVGEFVVAALSFPWRFDRCQTKRFASAILAQLAEALEICVGYISAEKEKVSIKRKRQRIGPRDKQQIYEDYLCKFKSANAVPDNESQVTADRLRKLRKEVNHPNKFRNLANWL